MGITIFSLNLSLNFIRQLTFPKHHYYIRIIISRYALYESCYDSGKASLVIYEERKNGMPTLGAHLSCQLAQYWLPQVVTEAFPNNDNISIMRGGRMEGEVIQWADLGKGELGRSLKHPAN